MLRAATCASTSWGSTAPKFSFTLRSLEPVTVPVARMLPMTWSFCDGLAVPMPTLPPSLSIKRASATSVSTKFMPSPA
jgi:hypothetical protein